MVFNRITVKFHLTAADDRGVGAQLTTRPVSVRSTRGRIPFGAGHLGSIEEYSVRLISSTSLDFISLVLMLRLGSYDA